MNKAKIMLAAVAAFAVVGGSLAFKAKQFSQEVLFRPSEITSTLCNVAVISLTTIEPQPLGAFTTTTSYSTVAGPCTTGTIYTVNDAD